MILLKWLITGMLIYFLYKRFFALPPPQEQDSTSFIRQKKDAERNSGNDDEYIDYEEVD